MLSFSDAILYVLTFLIVYIQIFFLITFLENRKKVICPEKSKISRYPGVTIIVPCWNEEKTVYKTVRSLLDLNYPKDKVEIFLVDDGSTDGTWNAIRKFSGSSNMKVFHKENGGKYTALNLGLEHVRTDFLGCLDADSKAHPDSLARIMAFFEKDPEVMAVSPSIMAGNSKNVIQNAQKAEYDMTVYIKKILGLLGAIHVTPGPLTIFRKKVFDDLGPYRHAHNTEDMEIAYRMQKHRYKIEQCSDAYVYTETPATIAKLYRQRLRWLYGFINNTIDYRKIMFKKKYGNFSLFTVPSNLIFIFAVGFLLWKVVYGLVNFLSSKILELKTVGLDFFSQTSRIDPFFINAKSLLFISFLLYFFVILSIIIGKRMAEGKWSFFSFNMVYFIFIYAFISPFWVLKAVYNTVLSRKPDWR